MAEPRVKDREEIPPIVCNDQLCIVLTRGGERGVCLRHQFKWGWSHTDETIDLPRNTEMSCHALIDWPDQCR